MYWPKITRVLYFFPAAGYFLFAYDSRRNGEKTSKSSFALNLFENTVLYLFVGLYAGFWRLDTRYFLPFIALIAGLALYGEMLLIRRFGMKFPRSMQWWRLQQLRGKDLLENSLFYLLQSVTFFSIGLMAYSMIF